MPMWDAVSNAPFVWMVAHLIGAAGFANPFFIRLPSALFGTACIVLTYWLAQKMFSKPVATVSAILFAIHPFAVAFNRILFADTFQLFFILAGCIAFEYYARENLSERPTAWFSLVLVFLFWGAAFLMKYNAVVPGAVWLASGVIARRYSARRAIVAFMAMGVGAFVTLLPWPYDAPVWLFAFLGKGGSYSIAGAAHFFWAKLHLILFGLTEVVLIAGIVLSIVKNHSRGSIMHLTLFLLLYLSTIIVLGRSFERYLLMAVPFALMLLVGVSSVIPGRGIQMRWMMSYLAGEARQPRFSKWQYIGWIALFEAGWLLGGGIWNEYSNYFSYLRNDYSHAALARDAMNLEQSGLRAFWLIPEPIGGYYLGFSQFYSRTVRPCLDGNLGEQNYFEWESMPYCEHMEGTGIFAIRALARRWGAWRMLAHPARFADSARSIRAQITAIPPPPAIDYLTSDFVRPGDLLMMQSGMTEVQEEPILEDISHESGPPYFKHLPLDRFRVLEVLRPSGRSSLSDTTITRIEAGAWIMVRK